MFSSPALPSSAILLPIIILLDSAFKFPPILWPIKILLSPVSKTRPEFEPIITLFVAPASIDSPEPEPNIILSEFNLNEWNDPDIVNEPVITASPVNGNGVVDIFDNCEPSPKYVPNDAVEVALEDTLVLTTNPKLGDIDAVAEPLAIWDKFNPTIPAAGILVNPEPLPSNDPENEPEYDVLVSSVVVLLAKEDDVALNAPDILDAIWAELHIKPQEFNTLIAD